MAKTPATRGRGWQASVWNDANDWRRWEQVGLKPSLDLNDVVFNWIDRNVKDLDVKSAVTGMAFERTIEGASTLTVTVRDPLRHLFNQPAGRVRTRARTAKQKRDPVTVDEGWEPLMPPLRPVKDLPVTWAPQVRGSAMEIQLDGWTGRLVKVGYTHSTSEVTLTFEDRIVYWLRRKRGELKVSRAASTRAEFVLRLLREIKAVTVPFVCPELHVRQPIDGVKTPGNGGGNTAVLHVGDSLAVGTIPYEKAELGIGRVTGDAKVGRTSSQTLDVLRDRLTDKYGTVVFDAGTNDDPTNPAALRTNLEAAKQAVGDRVLVVATLNRGNADVTAMNAMIKDFADQSGVRLVDWGEKGDPYLSGDGTHPTDDGYKYRAKLFADTIGRAVPARATTRTWPVRSAPATAAAATADPDAGGGFPAGAKLTVKGAPASKAQRQRMDGILTEARALGASADVMAACLACAIQESTMGQDAHMTGNDDVGIFQQGRNWIPAGDVMNPRLTTNAFLLSGTPAAKGKGTAPGWKVKHGGLNKMPGSMEAAIKAVQVSIGGYAPWEAEARRAVKLWGGPTAEGDAGTTTRGGSSAKAYQFTRNKDEDSWTAIQRLAGEVGWRCFMVGQAAYFMSEQDLFGRRARYELTPDSPALLELTYDVDWGKPVSEASMTVALDRWGAPPGSVILMDGFGPPDGRWLITSMSRDWFASTAEVTLKQPGKQKLEPAHEQTQRASAASAGGGTGASRGKVSTDGGARGIVEQAFEIARQAGGEDVYVGSDSRPGSTTSSGNVSDHARNDTGVAARDIGVRGINLITGPPSPKLDKAVVAIGKAFGRNYGSGTSGPFQNADNIQFQGYRIQIIWRTPKYGGHMGHIHIGAKRGG